MDLVGALAGCLGCLPAAFAVLFTVLVRCSPSSCTHTNKGGGAGRCHLEGQLGRARMIAVTLLWDYATRIEGN